MNSQNQEQMLVDIDNLLRTLPELKSIRSGALENQSWLGAACSVVDRWDAMKGVLFSSYVSQLNGAGLLEYSPPYRNILTMLYQARADIQSKMGGTLGTVVAQGALFDYFDELRKVIAIAKVDLLFVDPYLNAEFVSSYLPYVAPGVAVRLLSSRSIVQLLPAVTAFSAQHGTRITVRSSNSLHDRHILVDGNCCYQSGASFKDGAKKAPTTITPIITAFSAVKTTLEDLWNKGSPKP
jgi:hypothetical protein